MKKIEDYKKLLKASNSNNSKQLEKMRNEYLKINQNNLETIQN